MQNLMCFIWSTTGVIYVQLLFVSRLHSNLLEEEGNDIEQVRDWDIKSSEYLASKVPNREKKDLFFGEINGRLKDG